MTDKLPPDLAICMGRYLFIKDIERCPYKWGTPECEAWNKRDDVRLRQLAIARGWRPNGDSSPSQRYLNFGLKGGTKDVKET